MDVARRCSAVLEPQNSGSDLLQSPGPARSVLPSTYKRTEMVLAGKTMAEVIDGNKAAFERGELPALEPGSMSYMMSKEAYLTDDDDHNLVSCPSGS